MRHDERQTDQLTDMLGLARSGIRQLTEMQREALGDAWPFREM